jgi:formate hydrogenlyase transcriptional activator
MTHGSAPASANFDRFLAEMSTWFLSLPAEGVDKAIDPALESIGSFLDLDRVIISEFLDDGRSADVTHSWASPKVKPIRTGVHVPAVLPMIFQQIRSGQIVRIPDTSVVPPEWEHERREFIRSGARAHLSMPFAVAGSPLGMFTLVSVRGPHDWSDDQVEQLTLLAQILTNALSRRNSEVRLRVALTRVEELQSRLEAENTYLRNEIGSNYDSEGIIGSSPAVQRVLALTECTAPTDVTVLILGETGTGKELFARAIHARSQRNDRPLIKVNCAALPDSLAESELFGHEKGAFTGAVNRRLGRFELADRGTIFLDEVGDLSPAIQAKLLRVLQEGEFERLGSEKTRSVNTRVIAATSKDPEQLVEEGKFRADLYYRLCVVPIEIPPLRKRQEDIPILTWHFIEKSRERHGKTITELPQDLMQALVAYDWPGNVRELENVIERAVVLSPGDRLQIHDALIVGATASTKSQQIRSVDSDLASVERAHIIGVLEQCGWKVKGAGNAAAQLGLNASTLRGKMRKLGIGRPR